MISVPFLTKRGEARQRERYAVYGRSRLSEPALLQTAARLDAMLRFNEAVALDYVIPFRILGQI